MANEIKFIISAVDNVSRNIASVSKSTVKDLAKITGAVAGVTTALVAFETKIAGNIRELQNQARVANTSVQSFQAIASAAKQFNVSAEQTADIIKDVNDKIGDFTATGGGELQEFFTKIAPRVGVTAQMFKDLSGPDSLQLYVSSLEKANLSQQEMTFFLEAIGNDLTKLQPLFANNGQLISETARRLDKMGVSLNDMDVANLSLFRTTMGQLTEVGESFLTKVAAELAPFMTAIAKQFLDTAENTNFLGETTGKVSNFIISAVGNVANVIRGLDVVFLGIKFSILLFKDGAVSAFIAVVDSVTSFVNSVIEQTNKAIDALNKIPKVDIATIDVVGDSAFMIGLRASSEETKKTVDEMGARLKALALQEMPSDKVEEFVAGVRASMSTAAKDHFDLVNELGSSTSAAATSSVQAFFDFYLQKMQEVSEINTTFSESMAESLTQITGQAIDSISSTIGTAIVSGQNLMDSLAATGKAIIAQLLSSLIKLGIQRLLIAGINKVATTKEATVEGAKIGASTFGNAFSSTAAIPIIGPILAPGVAAASLAAVNAGMVASAATTAASMAGVTGAAHGGLGFVPKETTMLLDKGERVVSPRQNRDLTGFLDGQDGTGTTQQASTVTIETLNVEVMPNATNGDFLLNMNPAELRENVAVPLVEAIEQIQLQGFVTEAINRSTS